MNKKEAQSLLTKYLEGRCTPEEKAAVEQWYNTLQSDFDWALEGERRTEAQQLLKQKIDRAIGVQPPVVPLYRRTWLRYAAAILLVASAATWMMLPRQPPVVRQPLVADVMPGGNKATLTLGNGAVISLDSNARPQLATQGNTQISQQQGGAIVYSGGKGDARPDYNTLATPKGGQYRLTLPDGSKVWLNAMSSIRFPVSFAGNERRVEVQGEAFFEVAAISGQPFIVSASNTDIAVLGTRFNVNAYADERTLKTTLLQGKVKVSSANTVILSPGQQSVSSTAAGKQTIQVVNNADTELATAWMNGYFQFKQADIREVMQQISRWYDIEVTYEGSLPSTKFSGEIARTSKLSEVLTGLAMSGINTKVKGNQVIVIP